MVYKHYITKKRLKEKVICGNVNIPYGAICDARDGFIFHNDNILCATTSQNAIDYFWGYDPENPEAEIKRQELVMRLYSLAPPDSAESLLLENNFWRLYGELEEFYGAYRWEWKKDIVSDLPALFLEELLFKIKKDAMLFDNV